MRFRNPLLTLFGLLAFVACPAAIADETPSGFSVISWNVSDDAYVREPDVFQRVLSWADPDIVLLDEFEPSRKSTNLGQLFPAPAGWNIHIGSSGGRQRQVIASRTTVIPMPEFAEQIDYPKDVRDRLWQQMSERERSNPSWTMDGGIAVSGAIVERDDRRLLIVVTDLQCCGDTPQSWQESRRRFEASVIRSRIRDVLAREPVDALLLAGDFNLVTGAFTLSILGGPYASPIGGAMPAEIYHDDGVSAWTWDGRGTPFPKGVLDFQLFSPGTLDYSSTRVLDTELADRAELERYELKPDALRKTGRHRPLLVRYHWKSGSGE